MTDRARHGRQSKALKQQLPYPYNQDLSKVLRGLNRRTPFGRRRQANDPVTAAYLAAAVRLIQRQLGPGTGGAAADPQEPDSLSRPLLGFLSQRAVAAEVSRNPFPFHQVGRVSTLRERWRHQSSFVADVLRFCLWASQFPAAHRDEIAGAQEEAIHGPDPVRGIHHVCYWDLTTLLATPMFRLGLIAAAQAEGDPLIRSALSERHRQNAAQWKELYEEFLQSRGLRLRPGITLDDCVALLSAVAEGLAVRALPDPALVIDTARRRSLLGTATLVMIAGCAERADRADGVPLEQGVHDLLCAPPAVPPRRVT